MSDRSLIEDRRRDDRFDAAYRAHARRIFHFCLARTGSAADAEDLTAEAFTRFLRSERGVAEHATLPWLFTVARRLCIDHARSRRRHEDVSAAEGLAAPALVDPLEDAHIWRALGQLKPTAQQVVYLRIVEDLPFKDIARMLRTTEVAARMRHSRALRELGTLLKDGEADGENIEGRIHAAVD